MSQAIWKQHPFKVKSYLYLWEPEQVFVAQLTENVNIDDYPFTEIDLTSAIISRGNIFLVEKGMTILIGSSPGLDNLGRTRVRERSYNGTSIPIGRTPRGNKFGEMNLSTGAYVTVLNHYDVFSKMPHIDPETGRIFKDETSYNRAIAKPPIAHAGEHIAGFVDPDTGLLTVDFDGSQSTIVDSSASAPSYLWNFGAGATPSTANTLTVSGVTFPAGPPRYISFTVFHNSVAHTTRRIVYAAPREGEFSPIGIAHDNYVRELSPEGQTFTCRIKSDISNIIPGSIVLFMQEETFGDDAGPLVFLQ